MDFLPDECFNKVLLEGKARNIFNLWGYCEVEPSSLECLDIFFNKSPHIKQESIFKFFELGNQTIVLRPDFTIPIARIAATKLRAESLPMRFSYIGNIYRYKNLPSGKQREIAQAGVELMGIVGAKADAEVITIAIEILKSIGLTDFQIDMGQVEFYKGLIEKYNLTQDHARKLTEIIDKKNTLALKTFLDKVDLSEDSKDLFMKLPLLYGDISILKEAGDIVNNPRSEKAIENLYDVYEILKANGLSQYITFDLGMVHSIDYYTGIIFRGMTTKLGYPICVGGRYDNLVSEFGYDLPATGFALNVKSLLIALENQKRLLPKPGIDVLVVFDDDKREEGYKHMQKLRKAGKKVEHFLLDPNQVDPYQYAKSKSINTVVKI